MSNLALSKFATVLGVIGMGLSFESDVTFLAFAVMACVFLAAAVIIEEVQKK